jgi:hypothetical protein
MDIIIHYQEKKFSSIIRVYELMRSIQTQIVKVYLIAYLIKQVHIFMGSHFFLIDIALSKIVGEFIRGRYNFTFGFEEPLSVANV